MHTKHTQHPAPRQRTRLNPEQQRNASTWRLAAGFPDFSIDVDVCAQLAASTGTADLAERAGALARLLSCASTGTTATRNSVEALEDPGSTGAWLAPIVQAGFRTAGVGKTLEALEALAALRAEAAHWGVADTHTPNPAARAGLFARRDPPGTPTDARTQLDALRWAAAAALGLDEHGHEHGHEHTPQPAPQPADPADFGGYTDTDYGYGDFLGDFL